MAFSSTKAGLLRVKLTMQQEELAKQLESWFTWTDTTSPRFWKRNPTAIVIQRELAKLGHWRRAPNKANQSKSPKPEAILRAVINDQNPL